MMRARLLEAVFWKHPLGRARSRWVVYGAVVGISLIAVRLAGERDHRAVPAVGNAPVARPEPMERASVEPAIPELELARLGPRQSQEPELNPFGPSWAELEAEEARRNAPPPPPPPPPQAPPLPFAIMGKLIEDGKVVAFLMRNDEPYIVRRGDVIDGTYRVEELSETSLTFTYLPLDSRQSLALGDPVRTPNSGPVLAAPATGAPPVPPAAPPVDPTKLVWLAPPKVAIGEDFTIKVGLPPGALPRTGRVELVYDPRVLAILGGAAPAASSSSATTRRAAVEVIGPGFPRAPPTPSEVRFRVLTANPVSTQIGIENLAAVTSGGNSLVVASSPAHRLEIVSPHSGGRKIE
jgi:hypothetical protein